MVPEHPGDEGVSWSREAQVFWESTWQGKSLMAIGQQDPVLGEPVMRALAQHIKGTPEPLLLPQAGHFVQEHGEGIAKWVLEQWC
jgi:tRNA(adenine34) deaminase